MDNIKECISTAIGRRKADLVLKNALIVDVFSQGVYKGDVAIVKDRIAAIGKYGGYREINCEGLYVSPSFIDAHVHVESSKSVPRIFSDLLLKRGVTACIADPHEIANVLGCEGIDYMICDSKRASIDIFFMIPSCVPAVSFEDSGANLKADDLMKYAENPSVLGLGEVMDVPAVINMDDSMMKKILTFREKAIDGHCPGIKSAELNGYLCSGIMTDHECSSVKQAIDEVKRGMYVMLREGSAARNLRDIIPAVNEYNYHRFLFCTDDKDICDLSEDGSIDHNIRLAIKYGVDPIKAITIGSLNAAQCYGLKYRGAVAPGYLADLVILKDIENIEIDKVIRKGEVVVNGGNSPAECDPVKSSIFIDYIESSVFKIKAGSNRVNVICAADGSIVTTREVVDVCAKDGYVLKPLCDDVLKIAVFERHRGTGKYAVGFIRGLGMKGCSIAQTISHDSHNIIVVGDDDNDMAKAVNRVIDMKGGICAVSSGQVLGEIELPVAGLMTDKPADYTIGRLSLLRNAVRLKCSNKTSDIFTTLSFMALPVIPEVKMTTNGLYDFTQEKFISIFE